MAVGTDGRYYAEAEIKGKGSQAFKDKFAAKAEEAAPKASNPDKVDAPVPDGDANVRDNAGSTVPLTGEDTVNPVTAKPKK